MRAYYHVQINDIPFDKCLFCTLSIAPKHYYSTRRNVYLVWRRFIDRIRKHPSLIIGYNSRGRPIYKKVKFDYIAVTEYSDGKRAKQRGLPSTYRLHYHAVIFNSPLEWWQLKDLWDRFVGIAWVSPLDSFDGVAYTVKYAFKDNSTDQQKTDIDQSQNGKLFVSHGFGRITDQFKKKMCEELTKTASSWFFYNLYGYTYPVPRYWKNLLFSDDEVKHYNRLFVPKLLAGIINRKYRNLSYMERFYEYFNLLNPNWFNYGLNVSYAEASTAFKCEFVGH